MTHRENIRRHLEEVGSITTFEAFTEYGCTRLSSVIFDLRAQGMPITSTKETIENRFGQKRKFNRYHLMKGEH